MCGLNSDGFGFFSSTDGGNLRNLRVPAEREAMATIIRFLLRNDRVESALRSSGENLQSTR